MIDTEGTPTPPLDVEVGGSAPSHLSRLREDLVSCVFHLSPSHEIGTVSTLQQWGGDCSSVLISNLHVSFYYSSSAGTALFFSDALLPRWYVKNCVCSFCFLIPRSMLFLPASALPLSIFFFFSYFFSYFFFFFCSVAFFFSLFFLLSFLLSSL